MPAQAAWHRAGDCHVKSPWTLCCVRPWYPVPGAYEATKHFMKHTGCHLMASRAQELFSHAFEASGPIARLPESRASASPDMVNALQFLILQRLNRGLCSEIRQASRCQRAVANFSSGAYFRSSVPPKSRWIALPILAARCSEVADTMISSLNSLMLRILSNGRSSEV